MDHIEVWRDIDGYDGKYQVSNKGNVRSVDKLIEYSDGRQIKHKGKQLKPLTCKEGYLKVNLWKNNQMRKPLIHTLVAKHFLHDYYEEGYVVNHIDFDRTNNEVENLEWVTQYDNVHHTNKAGRGSRGIDRETAKLDDESVRYIRKHYKRRDKRFGTAPLAKKFDVNPTLISRVARREAWKHVE